MIDNMTFGEKIEHVCYCSAVLHLDGAVAALSQNKTYPADVAYAHRCIDRAIEDIDLMLYWHN